MRPLPQPTSAEIADALRDAILSSDPTVREMLRALVLITRAVHAPPATYWDTLPEFTR